MSLATEYLQSLLKNLGDLRTERKDLLTKISDYTSQRVQKGDFTNLIFICTHNSRRSHLSQLWAQVAADYYHIPGVSTFSGGTEATAFHPNAVAAMERVGFDISKKEEVSNPVYQVSFDPTGTIQDVWSKEYDSPDNPSKDFGAIMTCSSADLNCPVVIGSDIRVPLTYDDPKVSDETPEQERMYDERCREIALELFYCFSQVQSKSSN